MTFELTYVESRDFVPVFDVEKLRWLDKQKTVLRVNDFLSISGFPKETHLYKLGNKSALDWLIYGYQKKLDDRSHIVNDPNQYSNSDKYLVNLIGQVVSVSIKTTKIISDLPAIGE